MTTKEQRAEWARLSGDGTFRCDEGNVIDALLADLAAAESEWDEAREALRARVDALARARHTSHNRMTLRDYWRLYARPAHDRAISALNGAPAKEESRER